MTCRFVFVHKEGMQETYEWEAGRTLARDMLAHLRDTLAKKEMTFDDIEAIGVFRGPGSFTGLRIGATVLNTLADARSIPIVGVMGDAWESDALDRIERGEDDALVMPFYGSEAHVTTPRK